MGTGYLPRRLWRTALDGRKWTSSSYWCQLHSLLRKKTAKIVWSQLLSFHTWPNCWRPRQQRTRLRESTLPRDLHKGIRSLRYVGKYQAITKYVWKYHTITKGEISSPLDLQTCARDCEVQSGAKRRWAFRSGGKKLSAIGGSREKHILGWWIYQSVNIPLIHCKPKCT